MNMGVGTKKRERETAQVVQKMRLQFKSNLCISFYLIRTQMQIDSNLFVTIILKRYYNFDINPH